MMRKRTNTKVGSFSRCDSNLPTPQRMDKGFSSKYSGGYQQASKEEVDKTAETLWL